MAATARLFLDRDGDPATGVARIAAQNLLVAVCYILTGYLGLRLAFIGHSVTLFWPPSGIAFAALWIGGQRLLPGVFLGALVVNLITAKNFDLAFAIALGNTASTILATYLMRRRLVANAHAGELQRVMSFILFAVLAGTMISASVGTVTVSILGQVGASRQSIWLVWWMGDAMGVLIVAPPILLWLRIVSASRHWRNLRDAIAFAFAGFAIIAGLAFIHNPIWAVELCKLFTLLLSLWAGARFGLNGPAAVTLLMAMGAVGVTALGIGPFVRGSFYDSFALVHSYLFAEAIAGMLLAAALADLRRAVDREHAALGKVEAASANRIRLMSMISHDLRTPMAGIMGILQTLDRLVLPTEQKRLVALGWRAGTSLTELTDHILEVARVDTGQLVLHDSVFSPAQCIEDIVAMNRDAALAKLLDIGVEIAPSLPDFVLGDRVRFEQIVGNLVANAVTHSDSGRIAVSARWAERLVVEVSDTGPGIDPELVPHIFDAFVQARPQQSHGLGLGLHICRQLAEMMGGDIVYHRTHPTGSQFCVSLPLPQSSQPAATAIAVTKSQPGLQILLIDDDRIASEATSALLMALGHVVTCVDSAETAIAIIAARGFDLILTDIHLNGSAMQGLDCVSAVRALPPASPACVIIALTGNAADDERAHYLRCGLDGVLLKPFTATTDLTAIVTAIRANMNCRASQPIGPM